jgi:hypothetical protein
MTADPGPLPGRATLTDATLLQAHGGQRVQSGCAIPARGTFRMTQAPNDADEA